MKNKIFTLLLSAFFVFTAFSGNLTLAKEYNPASPYYILMLWGNFNPEAKNLTEKKWEGSVEIQNGNITLGKEIFITSDEKITNSKNDTGAETAKIEFETKTKNYFKGAIFRIFPDADSVDTADRVTFMVDEMSITTSVKKLEALNMREGLPDGTEIIVRNIQFMKDKTLEERNSFFYNKLQVLNKFLKLESWIRTQYESGNIDITLFKKFRALVEKSFDKTYSDSKTEYFVRLFTRLSSAVNKNKISNQIFYNGVVGAFYRMDRL